MLRSGWSYAASGLLFCALAPTLSAAPEPAVPTNVPYRIDKWDTEGGLPNNEVLAITQTRDGYLWLGTLNGLVRFDGVSFTVFDESNTPGLKSSRIVSLFEDSQGNLWIGTETAGIAVMKDGQVVSPPGIGSGGAERRLRAVCEGPDGAVWLYNQNGDLWRYWQGSVRRFVVNSNQGSLCRALIAEPSGPVWVGTDHRQSAIGAIGTNDALQLPVQGGLEMTSRLDFLLASQQGGYWRLADGRIQKWFTKGQTNQLAGDWGTYPWKANISISAACEDRQGNLLVGTLGAGVWRFDGQTNATCLSTNEGLSDNYILSLHVDHEGALWVGTDGGGLNLVKRQVFQVLEESRNSTVQSVSEDDQGGLWIGFNVIGGTNANGVGCWRAGEMQWFGGNQGLFFSTVWSVFADRDQKVWAGTYGGLFLLWNGKFQWITRSETFAIHKDRTNRLWFGTRTGVVRLETNGLFKSFSTNDGLAAGAVRAIADDPEGNIWIGTVGGGLSRLRDDKFTSFHKSDGLPSEEISSLYVDEEGVLWVGTFGGGLGRFHDGKWTRYTTREGLVSNSVGYLLGDEQGNLWIGSNAGLMQVQKKALNDFANGLTTLIPFRAHGKLDGLPSSECTLGSQPGACRTGDGKLWFPTIKGLASLDPARFNPNTNPPPVLIEAVLVEGQAQNTNRLRVGWPHSVTLPPGKERLEIHYTSLNLASAQRALFKYRMEGHEKDWTPPNGTRVAYYGKLPPGQYRFQVKACNEDGVWNEAGSTLAITVEPPPPPFWRTWWFRSTSIACFLGTIIAVVHYLSTQKLQRQLEGLRQQEALEKERSRIARDIHDQLGASLTQVALLGEFVESDKDSPMDVEAHARQISQTARDTTRVLDEIVWTVNPSNDTLDGLITYVCKYAQEYLAVAGVRYRLDVPAELPATPIVPELRHNVFLASKEAITNVVRHAKASAVWIRLRLQSDAFVLEIQDDGRGAAGLDAKAAQARNGLRNMRKRMEDVGGSFTLGPAPEGGTLVRLTAPLRST